MQALIALAGVDADAVWLLLMRVSRGEGGAGPPPPPVPPEFAGVFPPFKQLLPSIKRAGGTSIAEGSAQAGLRKRAHALLGRIEGTGVQIAWHKRAPVPVSPV